MNSDGFAGGFEKTAIIGALARTVGKGIFKGLGAVAKGGVRAGSAVMPKTTGGKINTALIGLGALGDIEAAQQAYARKAVMGR